MIRCLRHVKEERPAHAGELLEALRSGGGEAEGAIFGDAQELLRDRSRLPALLTELERHARSLDRREEGWFEVRKKLAFLYFRTGRGSDAFRAVGELEAEADRFLRNTNERVSFYEFLLDAVHDSPFAEVSTDLYLAKLEQARHGKATGARHYA